MASMTEITCKCGCGRKKMVRTADVKRGWGKYFSKGCKAKEQERRTGQHYEHQRQLEGQGDFFDGAGFDNTAHQNEGPNDPFNF